MCETEASKNVRDRELANAMAEMMTLVRAWLAGLPAHLPVHLGGRFSMKARRPSS